MSSNFQLGFEKEVHFYSVLVPEYKSVQHNAGIPKEEMLNIFPPYHSARLKLEDNDALILMGDVREEGYQISCLRFVFISYYTLFSRLCPH